MLGTMQNTMSSEKFIDITIILSIILLRTEVNESLHRFVGQTSVGRSRFQSGWSKTFIERTLGHLIEIYVAQ